jgi:methyl-accepting chemotaxis protein
MDLALVAAAEPLSTFDPSFSRNHASRYASGMEENKDQDPRSSLDQVAAKTEPMRPPQGFAMKEWVFARRWLLVSVALFLIVIRLELGLAEACYRAEEAEQLAKDAAQDARSAQRYADSATQRAADAQSSAAHAKSGAEQVARDAENALSLAREANDCALKAKESADKAGEKASYARADVEDLRLLIMRR